MPHVLQRFFDTYGNHFRETIRLSGPVIIGQLGFTLMGVIDSLMIGDISYVHLSASSLANGMFIIITIVGMGITFALTPLVAEAEAAGRNQQVGVFLRQGTYVGLLASLVLGVLVFGSAEALYWLDQPEQDIVLADSYLKILSLSVLPFLLFMVYKQFTDGLSRTRVAMYMTLLGLAINVGANWVLIYGHLGFPRMELDGAGWGTLLSRIVMVVGMVGYVMWDRSFDRFSLRQHWGRFDRAVMRKILDLGLPAGMQHFFEVAAFIGCTFVIGWMPEASANRAAHQIVLNLASIAFMVSLGISMGATIRVGNALGRRDFPNLRRAGLTGIMLAMGFMLASAMLFIAGRHLLPAYFNDNPLVLEVSARLMIIAAFFQLFDGTQAIGVGILRGIQDVRIPTLITFVAYWVLCLPLGYLLGIPLGLGADGVWYALALSLMVSAILLSARFWHLSTRMIRQGELLPSMALPEAEGEMTEPLSVH
jgi:MATE family multidrug resistance protein